MKKNKYNMILLFLGILIVLLFMLFCLNNKEGMEVPCKYQYLSPNQQNTPLDDDTINKFILQFNNTVNQYIPGGGKLTRSIYDSWISSKVICSDEVQFYIKNNSFPTNEYIVGELTNNKNIIIPPPYVANTISNGYSARGIYQSLIFPVYQKSNDLSNPDTLEAYKISMGIIPEPPCDAAAPAAPAAAAPAAPAAPAAAPMSAPMSAAPMSSNVTDDACNASCNDFCRNMN
jgi:hypothetical protein